MTYTALIKFAPLTSLARVNDQNWKRPGRTMYDAGSLTFAPGKSSAPLLVDHDKSRQIGVVRELTRVEDTDGLWLAALATVTDRPCWLERGCRVSFAYASASTSHDVFRCEILRRGILTEISVLPPGCEPAEPLAQVLTLHPTETVRGSPTPADEEIILAPGTLLVRPGIGQVLGVR